MGSRKGTKEPPTQRRLIRRVVTEEYVEDEFAGARTEGNEEPGRVVPEHDVDDAGDASDGDQKASDRRPRRMSTRG